MPQHRRREVLPKRIIEKVKKAKYSEFFGNVYLVEGGGLTGPRYGFLRPMLPDEKKPSRLRPMDIQYTLKDNILTRTEFARGEPSIPVHMAHFDPVTGKRFSTVLNYFK